MVNRHDQEALSKRFRSTTGKASLEVTKEIQNPFTSFLFFPEKYAKKEVIVKLYSVFRSTSQMLRPAFSR